MLLLQVGKIDTNARDIDGSTALMRAASIVHKDTVEVVLSVGKADVGAKSKDGSTALKLVARNKHKDTRELLRLQVKRI